MSKCTLYRPQVSTVANTGELHAIIQTAREVEQKRTSSRSVTVTKQPTQYELLIREKMITQILNNVASVGLLATVICNRIAPAQSNSSNPISTEHKLDSAIRWQFDTHG